MIDELERIWKEAVVAYSGCHTAILLEELRKSNVFMYKTLLQSERAASSVRSTALGSLFTWD
jgi:hypothetical protein